MNKNLILLIVFAFFLLIGCNSDKKSDKPIDLTENAANPAIIPVSGDTLYANGRRNIFLVGRREKAGLFVERAIFPPSYRSNPHTHPGDLNITVIEGVINLALTGNPDSTANAKAYGPGSFIIIPANTPHFEWFTEKSVIDITGIGPLNTLNIPIIHSPR